MEENWLGLPGINPIELSPAVWAYIGDAVYELYIRNLLVNRGPAKTTQLHREAVERVKASFQAELLRRLEPYLNETELELVKRGRNVKTGHVPTGSDLQTYRHSTAFEALIGYLYLSDEKQRLIELLRVIGQLEEGVVNLES